MTPTTAPLTPPQQTGGGELTEKGRRTRDGIIGAAADLIHAQGVAATTLTDVRRSARVSSSQLYHYFGDKQELVRAVVDRQAQTVVSHQTAMHLDTLDAFRQWRRDLVAEEQSRYVQGGCPLGSLGADLAESDPVGREQVAAGFRQWAGVIGAGLARMQQDGVLPRNVDTGQLATGVLASLQGGLLMGQVERSAAPLDAALSAVITLLEGLADRARDSAGR